MNTATGLELHQFKWLGNDDLIGEIPHRWNHLADYDPPNPDVSLVHFTIGGPYFEEYRDCEYADVWRREMQDMLYADKNDCAFAWFLPRHLVYEHRCPPPRKEKGCRGSGVTVYRQWYDGNWDSAFADLLTDLKLERA